MTGDHEGRMTMLVSQAQKHKSMLAWRSLIKSFAGLLICLPLTAFASPLAQALSDCDQSSFESKLSSINQSKVKTDARAIWLDRSTLRWPGANESGTFKLYLSATGQIKAKKGHATTGSDGSLSLDIFNGKLADEAQTRFNYVSKGIELKLKPSDLGRLQELHKQQLVLVNEDGKGRAIDFTATQIAAAMDDLYKQAGSIADLGVTLSSNTTRFKLWAPTAQALSVCVYETPSSKASSQYQMQWDSTSGVWRFDTANRLDGKYYRFLVDVFVRDQGLVRNIVTDPYSISLSANSKRSYIADLGSAILKPLAWDKTLFPDKVKHQTDMVIYELHVRDFSINDNSVSEANRGKYLAFTETQSNGMKHLTALSRAGLTDVHLLPVFDIATIPEQGCISPKVKGPADNEQQQKATTASSASDCFNWGYDPFHFSAPEGSYASDSNDGAKRIIEFRSMVKALHESGLRVGMDVVYNHTSTSGQQEKSVLDRIVPGYYQRLNADGNVEHSTCCDNTATENMMMGKLMLDSVAIWAKYYKIDSFRFDLMGHQPRAVMETLQKRINKETGRQINLIGEGWNFGEVANGMRFVQASQLSLNSSGIGTFSDRARDAVRGGSAGDSGEALVKNQGYINGLAYDPNEANQSSKSKAQLLKTADLIRVGLAGSIRDYEMRDSAGTLKRLENIAYGDQPAGYANQPSEVVNYIDNHDNQTLFDINAYKLPLYTSPDDRARVQILGMAINTFSQGIAYFHAGVETLRSKSMDGNSYDSGDWFNRLDWTFQDNYFATGLPPARDNEKNYSLIKPRLQNILIKPGPKQIKLARDAFTDLLKIRSSSSLFRLAAASDIKQRLKFYNTGTEQNPVLLVGHLSGDIDEKVYEGSNFKELIYFVNVDIKPQRISIADESKKPYVLHPVHLNPDVADTRPAKQAEYQSLDGSFTIPARSAVVFVIEETKKP
jgi:pullulanase